MPRASRRLAKTDSHLASGSTPVTSGARSTDLSATSRIACRHERGVDANPDVTTSSE